MLIGIAVSALGLAWVSSLADLNAEAAAAMARGRRVSRTVLALATLVAVGIGVHNLGEGLAMGTSFALGELALGSFLARSAS